MTVANDVAAKPAPPGVSLPRAGRLAFHVPTPVLATLLGAALTVWIAPAFTRQWDDRERARDVKAAITQDMVGAAGPVIRSIGPLVAGRGDYASTRARWHEAGAKVGVKLGAYFPARVVRDWQAAVLRGDLLLIASDGVGKDPNAPIASRQSSLAENLKLLGLDPQYAGQTAGLLLDPGTRELGVENLGQWMWASLERTVDGVFSAHPSGFSTTRRDWLHDVLP
jgi:hypothetical protein